MPVSKVEPLAPWVGLAALMAMVVAAVAVRRRKGRRSLSTGLNMDQETIVATLSKGGALKTEGDLLCMKRGATARIVIVSISSN